MTNGEKFHDIDDRSLFDKFCDEICKVCPWNEESHHPEITCEGCSCSEALDRWKEIEII